MEDFQRITHHETDYFGTEGEKKERERKKKTHGKSVRGKKCENVTLASRSETVPGSGDVSKTCPSFDLLRSGSVCRV